MKLRGGALEAPFDSAIVTSELPRATVIERAVQAYKVGLWWRLNFLARVNFRNSFRTIFEHFANYLFEPHYPEYYMITNEDGPIRKKEPEGPWSKENL